MTTIDISAHKRRPRVSNLEAKARKFREALTVIAQLDPALVEYFRTNSLDHLPGQYPLKAAHVRVGMRSLGWFADRMDGGEVTWHRIPPGTTGAPDGGHRLSRSLNNTGPRCAMVLSLGRDYMTPGVIWSVGVGEYYTDPARVEHFEEVGGSSSSGAGLFECKLDAEELWVPPTLDVKVPADADEVLEMVQNTMDGYPEPDEVVDEAVRRGYLAVSADVRAALIERLEAE